MDAERFESALWQTSSLLLAADGEAVLVDPAITREEVARIAARAAELGLRVTAVLATHADWDHVCGIAAFPDAEAAMGERTADFVESGAAAERLETGAAEYGVEPCGPPRCDRRLATGLAHRVGPFVVEALALPGHTSDSTGYRIRALDLLVVGDYLSPIEFPYVSWTAAYRATLAALIELLRRDPPARVVVGHGPELGAAEALAIAEADLDYLWRLHDAVLAGGAEAGLAVEPPRGGDEEMRAVNVDTQLAELRP
ncbi:MAG TPA: MBL fold metallo-hydrolase [Gaiellaceae bacterium]|nr:MBL fold metallo-hydrolase [Gaiellaceae bacterium]